MHLIENQVDNSIGVKVNRKFSHWCLHRSNNARIYCKQARLACMALALLMYIRLFIASPLQKDK